MAGRQVPTSGHLNFDAEEGQYQISFPVTRDYSCPFTMCPHEIIFTHKLGHPARTLWLALNTYADKEAQCFPGLKSLSQRLGISERRLRVLKKELVKKGFLRVEARHRENGGQTSNKYTLLLPAPACASVGRNMTRKARVGRRVSRQKGTP